MWALGSTGFGFRGLKGSVEGFKGLYKGATRAVGCLVFCTDSTQVL